MRCAIEMQNGMVERNAGLPAERGMEFQVGPSWSGDVVKKNNSNWIRTLTDVEARLEGIAHPSRASCLLQTISQAWCMGTTSEGGPIDLSERKNSDIARPSAAVSEMRAGAGECQCC